MQILSFFYLLLFFVLLSCGQNSNNSDTTDTKKNPKIDSLYKIVMAKHDEVMPKTADIMKLTKILRQKLEIEKDNVAKEKILNHLRELETSNDGMMEWMHEFKNEHLDKEFYEKKSSEEVLDYLKKEENSIEQVAKLMLESIKNAELYLSKNNK
jgi:hypothetical protein